MGWTIDETNNAAIDFDDHEAVRDLIMKCLIRHVTGMPGQASVLAAIHLDKMMQRDKSE